MLQALSSQLAQLRTVLDVTQVSLAAERSAVQAALARADESDAALAQHRDALQACAAELESAHAARAELQKSVGERAQDVVRLQAELERLEELHRVAGERAVAERQAAAGDRSRLEREVQALRDALSAVHEGRDVSMHQLRQLHAQVMAAEEDKRSLESALHEARAEADAARKAQVALRQVVALQQHNRAILSAPSSSGGGSSTLGTSSTSVAARPSLRVTNHSAAAASQTGRDRTASVRTTAADSAATTLLGPQSDPLLSPGTAALQSALRKARARREGHDSAESRAADPTSAAPSTAKGEPPESHVKQTSENIDVAIAGLLEQLLHSDDSVDRRHTKEDGRRHSGSMHRNSARAPLRAPAFAVSPSHRAAAVNTRTRSSTRNPTINRVADKSPSLPPQFSRFVGAPFAVRPYMTAAERSAAAAAIGGVSAVPVVSREDAEVARLPVVKSEVSLDDTTLRSKTSSSTAEAIADNHAARVSEEAPLAAPVRS